MTVISIIMKGKIKKMPKPNRTCYCCGREYYYCPSCYDDKRDPSIYVMWDSKRCKDIFDILTQEFTHKITTKECKEALQKYNINTNTQFTKPIREHIDRVMAYKDPVQKDVKKKQTSEKVNKMSINNSEVI